MTGALSMIVHAMLVTDILVDPLPEHISKRVGVYPEGGHITNLLEIRAILHMMQRPTISSKVSVQAPPIEP